jgi:hypothetical protein
LVEEELGGAQRRLERARQAVSELQARATELEASVAGRATWDHQEGWRLERVADIDDTLAHHWADVTLRAVRADDPLAFGTKALRAARATHQKDLDRIMAALPPDRRDALVRAEAELHRHEETLRHAERALRAARSGLDGAAERGLGRRDKAALERAEAELCDAEAGYQRCSEAVSLAREWVGEEDGSVRRWTAATEETADKRSRLSNAIAEIDDALVATRPGRVMAAAANPASALQATLGPPPTTRGGLAAWCGIARRLEAWQDYRPDSKSVLDGFGRRVHPVLGPRPDMGGGRQWDEVAVVLRNAPELIRAAGGRDPGPAVAPFDDQVVWEDALKAAGRVIAAEMATRAVSRGHGIEL